MSAEKKSVKPEWRRYAAFEHFCGADDVARLFQPPPSVQSKSVNTNRSSLLNLSFVVGDCSFRCRVRRGIVLIREHVMCEDQPFGRSMRPAAETQEEKAADEWGRCTNWLGE